MKTLKTDISEIARYQELLTELAVFIKSVPVAHNVKTNRGEGKLVLNNGVFFKEDYSYVFADSLHTGIEIIALWKKLHLNSTVKSDIGYLFDNNKLSNTSDYRRTVHVALNSLESFCRDLICILAKDNIDASQWVFNNFFRLPFRNFDSPDLDKDYIIPSGDPRLLDFFLTVKRFRNDSTHHNTSSFSVPSGNENLIEYCRNIHLSIILFVIFILERFFNELAEKVTDESDWENPLTAISEEESNLTGKNIINTRYIPVLKEDARQRLRSSFRGTILYGHPELLEDELPELKIKSLDEEAKLESGILAESQGKFIISGSPGSGKTVMLLQLILHDKFHLLPLYFDEDEMNDSATPQTLVRRKLLGRDLLTRTPYETACTENRLRRLVGNGDAVFFFDMSDSSEKSLAKIAEFISAYPNCRIISTVRSESLGIVKSFFDSSQLGFEFMEICPFDRNQSRTMMKIYSVNMSGVDHTRTLEKKIRLATDGLPIMRHPLSLLLLIHLFETTPRLNLHSINRTTLYSMMIRSIEEEIGADEQEKKVIMEQAFIRQHLSDLDEIRLLRSAVCESLSQGNREEIVRKISESSFVKSDEKLQTLFEMIDFLIINESKMLESTAILRSLVTTTLLGNGLKNDKTLVLSITSDDMVGISEFPVPNPNLEKLAKAMTTIGYYPPTEKETNSIDRNIVYRLGPKYIVESYLVNILILYGKMDVACDTLNLTKVFKPAALLSTPRLIKMIFRPQWLRLWLIDARDKVEIPEMKGKAAPGNQLYRSIVDNVTDSLLFLNELIHFHDTALCLNMKKTVQNISDCIYEVISTRMNDGQLEQFVMDKSFEHLADTSKIIYWKNLAICCMDSLSLVDLYDSRLARIPSQDIQERLFALKRVDAYRLLSMWMNAFSHYEYSPARKKRYEAIFTHLVNSRAYTLEGVDNIFWDNVRLMLKIEGIRDEILSLLNSVPLEYIPEDITNSLYDCRIVKYQLDLINYEKEIKKKWLDLPLRTENRGLYRKVSKSYLKDKVLYSLYSHPDDITYVVATECINEMPEGKFCRLTDLDRWFSVQDVQDLQNEHNMSEIVYLLLSATRETSVKSSGKITVLKKDIPYVFAYKASDKLVLRIEDKNTIKFLSDNIKVLKTNQDCQIDENVFYIRGVDILPVNPDTRLIWLRPVRSDGSEYSRNPEKIPFFPPEGVMEFFHCKREDRKNNKYRPLMLKFMSETSRAKKDWISECMRLPSEKGKDFFAMPFFLEQGQWLWPEDSSWSAQVISSIDIRSAESESPEIPKNLKGYLWKLKKAGKAQKYFSISLLKFHGNKPEFKQEKEMEINVDVTWYTPMFTYIPPDEKHSNPPGLEVTYLFGQIWTIGNKDYIELPKTDYPKAARYYYSEKMPKRMPVIWAETEDWMKKSKSYMILDKTMLQLWKKTPQSKISFFPDSHIDKPLPIPLKSLHQIVNTGNMQLYHGSLLPLLKQDIR